MVGMAWEFSPSEVGTKMGCLWDENGQWSTCTEGRGGLLSKGAENERTGTIFGQTW